MLCLALLIYAYRKECDNNGRKESYQNKLIDLFNKAVKEQLVLIDDMIAVKDLSNKNFTDKEIILLLPDSSEDEIFSSYHDSEFYSKASIVDVEKSAKKLFDKTINVNSAQDNDSIRIIDDDVGVEVRSGVIMLNAELVSVDTINNDEYAINFKFDSGSGIVETHTLTVTSNNGNIVYEGFEK